MKKRSIIVSLILTLAFGIFSTSAQDNYTDNKDINSLIAKKRDFNKYNKTGYRIQLYYGDEKRAKSLKYRFNIEYPETYTVVHYKEPYWNIQVGNYKTKLQADRALNDIKEKFNGAIVVPL